mgnify:CR=1 FL=1
MDEIAAELTEIIDSIDEGDRGEFLNDDNTAFVPKEFAAKLAEIYADISSPGITWFAGICCIDRCQKPGKGGETANISLSIRK